MKKHIILPLVFFSFTCVFSADAQNFGIQGGFNFSELNNKIEQDGFSISLNSTLKPGVNIGGFYEVSLNKSLIFRPELNFSQKGGKLSIESDGDKISTKQTLNYIEIPLNFYYLKKTGKGDLLLGAGPYAALGISGKAASTVTLNGETTSSTVGVSFDGKSEDEITDEDVHYKALDVGLGFNAAYRFTSGLSIATGYSLGLSDISADAGVKLKNRCISIKLGYILGKK